MLSSQQTAHIDKCTHSKISVLIRTLTSGRMETLRCGVTRSTSSRQSEASVVDCMISSATGRLDRQTHSVGTADGGKGGGT